MDTKTKAKIQDLQLRQKKKICEKKKQRRRKRLYLIQINEGMSRLEQQRGWKGPKSGNEDIFR